MTAASLMSLHDTVALTEQAEWTIGSGSIVPLPIGLA